MKKHLTAGRIALYLLYLGLTTSLIVSVTYSRYAQEIKGQGVAQVAAVALDLTDDNGAQLDLTEQLKGLHPGEQKELVFAVTNKEGDTVSEVAQEYAITISTTGNLPLTYTLAPNNTDTSEGTYVDRRTAALFPRWRHPHLYADHPLAGIRKHHLVYERDRRGFPDGQCQAGAAHRDKLSGKAVSQ